MLDLALGVDGCGRMKPTHKKTLTLRVETLRQLRSDRLRDVAGGVSDDTLPFTYGYCASSPRVCWSEFTCRYCTVA